MKILWQSVAPFYGTGYGICARNIVPRLKALGHDIAIFAYVGLKGDIINWNNIPVFPNEVGDWGNTYILEALKLFKADICISQEDVWVLNPEIYSKIPWYPYVPIDHSPPPPLVLELLKVSIKPIAMSLFGKEQIKLSGLDAYYAPHGVDTKIFYPDKEKRDKFRKSNKWDDKFVIGVVATNKGERKNYRKLFQGYTIFRDICPNSILYCHTNPLDSDGLNLLQLAKILGISEYVQFPEESMLPVRDEAMAYLYNAIDVFCLPSKGEGFGLPLIESQACGTPVITTNFSACSELCSSGWLIEKLMPEFTLQNSYQMDCSEVAVFEALKKAYITYTKHIAEFNGIKQKAIEFAQKYDWDIIIDKYWKPILDDIKTNLYKSVYDKKLKIAKLTIVNSCAAKCRTCLTHTISDIYTLSREDIINICNKIKKYKKIGYLSINNIGDGFNLIPDFFSYIEIITRIMHSAGIKVGVTTNGYKAIPVPDIDDYIISFNGYDKESYETNTGLSYDEVINNINTIVPILKRYGVNVQIHYLSIDGDVRHEDEFCKLFKHLEIPLRISRKVENQFGLLDRPEEDRRPCDYLDMVNIHSNGDVIMCAHDFQGSVVWGNILKQELEDIINNPELIKKKQEHYNGLYSGLCENCNYNTSIEGKIYWR